MPQSLQDYYQGVGRAGRDGADAKIHLLFSPADVNIWKGIQRSRFRAPTPSMLVSVGVYGTELSLSQL